jgi:hypothetical protein
MLSFLAKTLARTFSGTSRDALKQGDYFGDVARTVSARSAIPVNEIMTSLTDKTARAPDDILAPLYKQIDEDLGHGVLRSDDSIDAMTRNLLDTFESNNNNIVTKAGELFAGLSRAGQTKPQALGFGAFGNPERLFGSVAGGAAFGAGAASISGGDVGEGALIGGAIGLSGAAAAKVFRESLGEIEESAMRGILGSNQVFSRSDNLAAIRNIDFDDAAATKGISGLDKFLGKRMNDTSKPSVGMQSRTAVASGALLSGLAFTSPAGSNKKRGFNKNRGNRF